MSLSDDIAALTGLNKPRWNSEAPLGTPIFVTYAFPTIATAYDPFKGFVAPSEAHKIHIRAALNTWDAASGIHFIEVPEGAGGQIRFSFVDMTGWVNAVGDPLSGQAYFPVVTSATANGTTQNTTGSMDQGGDVYLNANYYATNAVMIASGMRGYSIVLHEIGHALGLKHPFQGAPVIEPAHDNGAYTIMSYNRSLSTTALGSVDIATTQLLYGVADSDFSWDANTLSLTIYGGAGSDARVGTELNDTINGLDGNDFLVGKRGADTLNGGAGVDTALFSGARANYAITISPGNVLVIDGAVNRDGADTLISVERLKFFDAIVALDVDAAAGQAYRLYQAAFARTPDKAGLSYWVDKLDDGLALRDIASGFIGSAEFKSVYGVTPTPEQIVGKFYQNVLGRAGEAEGTAFWVSALKRGVSSSEVLAGFSDSAENVAKVAPLIGQGIALDATAFV